ncbi:MAG: hypothetical protein JJT75_04495 [Opitutales bacterium]|nr:hypothetical protein [Opitutales bacterium]MCH8541653.1 hypothetical protein [Opitutales bacterium]
MKENPPPPPSGKSGNPPGAEAHRSTDVQRREFLRKILGGLIAATIVGSAGVTFFRKRDESEDPESVTGPDLRKIEERIDQYFRTLSNELEIVWLDTKPKLDRAFSVFKKELQRGGDQFSEEIITRRAVAALVIDMARDSLDEGERVEDWFGENLLPYLQPAFSRLERRLQRIEGEFEKAFAAHIQQFNEKTAALLLAETGPTYQLPELTALENSTRKAFTTRGFQFGAGAGLGIGLTLLGTTGYIQATMFQAVVRAVKRRLIHLVRPIARRVALRMGASLLTAKFPPLSLLVMALGSATTAYEILRLRGAARQDFEEALEESLPALEKDFTQNVRLPFLQQLDHFQKNKQAIQSDIVNDIL